MWIQERDRRGWPLPEPTDVAGIGGGGGGECLRDPAVVGSYRPGLVRGSAARSGDGGFERFVLESESSLD